MSDARRFLKRLVKANFNEKGCWLSPHVDVRGYGRFRYAGKHTNLHRFSYEFFRGQIPAGMYADHLCRVRNCFNPDHLELVTNATNVLRGNGYSGRNYRKTHCKHGHPLEGSNLKVWRSGKGKARICLTCRRNYLSSPKVVERDKRRHRAYYEKHRTEIRERYHRTKGPTRTYKRRGVDNVL